MRRRLQRSGLGCAQARAGGRGGNSHRGWLAPAALGLNLQLEESRRSVPAAILTDNDDHARTMHRSRPPVCGLVLGPSSDHPLAALRRMAAALRPGGVVLAEDADYVCPPMAATPTPCGSPTRVIKCSPQPRQARWCTSYFGSTLPGLLTTVGLKLEGGEVDSTFARCGEPAYELERLTAEAGAPGVVAASLLAGEEYKAAHAMRSSPSAVMTTASVVVRWARRIN